jgi:hypothetical protein
MVSQARAKRDAIAVLLSKYMAARSIKPEATFIILEGNDDIGVWPIWFEKCGVSRSLESFPCRGKERVLEFRQRLLGRLSFDPGQRLFFVDRDFDKEDEHSDADDVFVTGRYSIENYFLLPRIVEYILDTTMGCAGEIAEKAKILSIYCRSLDEFVCASKEVNFRAFCLRRTFTGGVRPSLPAKLQEFVKVAEPFEIKPHDKPAEDIIPIPYEISTEIMEGLRAEFEKLEPLARYRGKFYRAFLVYFFSTLQADRNADVRKLFSMALPKTKIHYPGLQLSSLAALSDLPEGLIEFLKGHSLIEEI